jgi:DNA-directed RNA polymerase beta' subunit
MKSSEAQKAWKRNDYLVKKQYYLDRDRERYELFKQISRDAKNKPCADCGNEYPYYVMDFDHRESARKVRHIAHLKDFSSEEKLRKEISKCDVVCSNCHRIRTFERKQHLGIDLIRESDSGNLRALEA